MKILKRIFKAVFNRKVIARFLFVVACLVTLAAAWIAEENWRGKRDWEAYVRYHQAHNESLDITPLVPPPVPDEENFAMTPLLKSIFGEGSEQYRLQLSAKLRLPDVQGKSLPSMGDHGSGRHIDLAAWKDYLGADPLDYLQKFDPEMREITAASRLPQARFPLAYGKGAAMPFPQMDPLMKLGKLFGLRAEAELQAGNTAAAFEDTITSLRMARAVSREPLIISLLVQISLQQTAMQVIWEGLDAHKWTDAQLQTLQQELARADFATGLDIALRGERAAMNETIIGVINDPASLTGLTGDASDTPVMQHIPSGFVYKNLLELNRFYEQHVFSVVDPATHRFYPNIARKEEDALMRDISHLSISKVLERITMPAISSVFTKAAYAQVTTDQALIACAIERHRLATGACPDDLAKLTPAFLEQIPVDALDGAPMHYRANPDGTYLLYSNGWDGKDDGGKIVLETGGKHVDVTKGDWVWAGGNK